LREMPSLPLIENHPGGGISAAKRSTGHERKLYPSRA
jgi:hypothetical protein